MSIFKKIFGSKDEPEKPENTRFLYLLNKWSQNRTGENYELVVNELMNGNSYLILPSANDETQTDGWVTTKNDTPLKLTSIFDIDGLKVLGVFSDKAALLTWAKNIPSAYTALKSQAVIDLCERRNISRMVINSHSPNMFVMERNRQTKIQTVEKGTPIMIGTPRIPLNEKIVQSLVSNFSRIKNVLEAYQCMITKNNEANITIGIKLLSYSDDAKKAIMYAVQDALPNESEKLFLDIIFFDSSGWYEKIKNVEGALFYKNGM